ncbi:MAG: hypothetical protein ABSG37_10010 [Candidatus Limnocylindrales bacterium]
MVKLLMEERLREARQANLLHCCAEPEAPKPGLAARYLFRRKSPAACGC